MINNNETMLSLLSKSLWEENVSFGSLPDDLRKELQSQAVEGLTALAYPDDFTLKYHQAAHFIQMAKAQDEAVQLLQRNAIPVVVIKGTAAGIYYPKPYLRTYGDIDLMVQPVNYRKAVQALRSGGWVQKGEIGDSHTALIKNNFLCERQNDRYSLDIQIWGFGRHFFVVVSHKLESRFLGDMQMIPLYWQKAKRN